MTASWPRAPRKSQGRNVKALFTLILLGLTILFPGLTSASPCAKPDPERRETGIDECLIYRLFRSASVASNPSLVIVLHGDVSSGGPANYHRKVAERIAHDRRADNIISVALVRPGYEDGDGESSSGSHNNRSDHYTAKNIDEIAAVVTKLRDRLQARSVVLLGHSGGAAISGVLVGRHPAVANAAVLVSCPCDVGVWRAGRRSPWPQSESPHSWADKVAPTTMVVALTGSRDDNTSPQLAERYIESLSRRGIKSRFELLSNADHNSAFRSDRVIDAVFDLLAPQQRLLPSASP